MVAPREPGCGSAWVRDGASDEARFVTGTEIVVDGGMTARCDWPRAITGSGRAPPAAVSPLWVAVAALNWAAHHDHGRITHRRRWVTFPSHGGGGISRPVAE
jgi:hypothetical protein